MVQYKKNEWNLIKTKNKKKQNRNKIIINW